MNHVIDEADMLGFMVVNTVRLIYSSIVNLKPYSKSSTRKLMGPTFLFKS